ncbi:class I SAM-dependent methyltransferase [Cyanobacterium aponinum UTEX 3222]|uniref:class I SAM-dependent methyltransferase n=1 Tax=Cyanobacterium aponinum TaxID=379064 RepID=UPI00308645E9|nr:class I SAM-dependent methyltransferase [Cyanobacterium aponinum UTEX 3222]
MTIQTLNLTPPLYEYLLSVSLKEASILKEIREKSSTHPLGKMQIAPEQAQFISLLIKLLGVKKILEIGVFLGYSSTAMALALPEDGQLIACENNPEFAEIARQHWQKASLEDKIILRLDSALDTLEALKEEGYNEEFDLIFIDADKSNYYNYYEKSLDLLRKGGLIIIDNVLWHGRVANPEINDNRTKRMREFNRRLFEDERIELSLLPIGDGLTLVRKI